MAERNLHIWKQLRKTPHADQSPSTASERASRKTNKKNATPITIDSFFDSDNEHAMDYPCQRVASAKKSSDSRRISFDMDPEYKVEFEEYQDGMPKRIHRDPNKPFVFRQSKT